MKKTVKIRIVFGLLFFLVGSFVLGAGFFTDPMSKGKMKLLPVPRDYRNYFLLQSIDDTTSVIIGDFTGSDKLFSQIIDKNSDGVVERVVEYFVDSKKFKIRKKSSSGFVKDFKSLKEDIVKGTIFKENYCYKMKSLDTLKYKLKDGTDIFPYNRGYSVKFYDPDAANSIMSEFFFSKINDRYDLIFKTHYYKIYTMKIRPPVPFSVYCKNSKDPLIKETVEALLKMVVR